MNYLRLTLLNEKRHALLSRVQLRPSLCHLFGLYPNNRGWRDQEYGSRACIVWTYLSRCMNIEEWKIRFIVIDWLVVSSQNWIALKEVAFPNHDYENDGHQNTGWAYLRGRNSSSTGHLLDQTVNYHLHANCFRHINIVWRPIFPCFFFE